MTQWHPYHVMAARTWRFFDRYVDAVRTDAFANGGAAHNDAEDFLHAAFQCCWHIKDWIKNDNGIEESVRRGILTQAHADPRLRVVQGFANGTKHLEITPVGKGDQLRVDDGEVEFHQLANGDLLVRRFLNVAQTGERVAADLALRAGMTAWEEIVHANGLPSIVDSQP
ncbi:hypothetical protein [Gemmatimonas sp.]|uniref:hypothetical protein n=1 Tax=Gemmatimonas sp. TaxID=1962908 RepID=UPI00286DD687|nr:hypothetical protein [Gemmatimonas sp.]